MSCSCPEIQQMVNSLQEEIQNSFLQTNANIRDGLLALAEALRQSDAALAQQSLDALIQQLKSTENRLWGGGK